MADHSRPVAAAQAGAVLALAIFWAFNWPMMKIGLEVVEPWTFRALIVLTGAIGCIAVAGAMGIPIRLARSDWPAMIGVGLLQGVLWNAFSGFGIAMVDAGRAAVLAFTMPLWATLLSIAFLKESVTVQRFVALGLGLAGMALLLVPAIGAMGAALAGTLLMLGGALAWGAATVLFKGARWQSHVLTISIWQYIIGAVPLTAAALLLGRPETLLAIDGRTGAAIAFSALVPTIFCQVVWLLVVRRVPASVATMGTLAVPPLGVFFSAAVLGKRIGAPEIGAVVLVTVAIALVLPGLNLRASRRRPQASPPG